MERPHGLRPDRTMVDYLMDTVYMLSPYNSNVKSTIGLNYATQMNALRLFDTVAGPNLIRALLLPDEVIFRLKKGPAYRKDRIFVKVESAIGLPSPHRCTTFASSTTVRDQM